MNRTCPFCHAHEVKPIKTGQDFPTSRLLLDLLGLTNEDPEAAASKQRQEKIKEKANELRRLLISK